MMIKHSFPRVPLTPTPSPTVSVSLAALTKYPDWVAYQQQKFISPGSGGWESENRVPAWSGSGEGVFGAADL